jgi:tetratricopeptide (TPR) repeat protein
MALQQEDPETAIEELESARPCERGHLWTIYLRGEAHLAADQPSNAMAEFQKLLDLRSVHPDNTVHTVAHLGLARANAAAGDPQGAQEGYRAFFEIVAEADAGVPLIETARAEYEALLEKYGEEG